MKKNKGAIDHANVGGDVKVEGELDLGASLQVQPIAGDGVVMSSRQENQDSLVKGNEILLVVEDEPLLRNVVAHTLRDQGYTVSEAANRAEALEIASRKTAEEIDLVLTDYSMPGMDGADLAGRLRVIRPGIRILVSSGYQIDLSISEHTQIAYLPKPFTSEELVRTVRQALDAQHGQDRG